MPPPYPPTPPPPSIPPTDMVDRLVDFYRQTGGVAGARISVPTREGGFDSVTAEGWTLSGGWLSGEPCVDGWAGLHCCPLTFPYYRRSGGGWRCLSDDGEQEPLGNATADETAEIASASASGNSTTRRPRPSCGSGLSTGTAADAATCVVVAIELRGNGLHGAIDDELGDRLLDALPYLARLDLSDNPRLGGPLPPSVANLVELQLGDNSFWYDESDPMLRRLVKRCRTSGGVSCAGVPPISCGAFGPSYRVRLDDSERCVECPNLGVSIALQVAVLLTFAALIGAYIRVVVRYEHLGERLDLWINTAAIFFCHLQTVSIIGTLKLAWPRSVEAITEVASVDFLSLGAARPECALQLGDNSYYYFTLFRLALLITLMLGVSMAQAAVKRAGACAGVDPEKVHVHVDRLEMVETVLFTFGLTLSWRVIFDLWEQGGSSNALARWGTVVATILFLVQLQMLAKYALNLRALSTGRSWGSVAKLPNERLQRRLSFLTERFSAQKPFWQFVVWLRQFILTLDVWLAGLAIDEHDDVKLGVVTCDQRDVSEWGAPMPNASMANGSMSVAVVPSDVDSGGWGNATSGANDTAMDGTGTGTGPFCQKLSAASLSAIWTHVTFALLTFFFFWWLQIRHQPYAYPFQNTIESWLFLANVLLVSLGTVYTALKYHGNASAGLEIFCATFLLSSLLAAAAFMAANSREAHMARRHSLVLRAQPSGIAPLPEDSLPSAMDVGVAEEPSDPPGSTKAVPMGAAGTGTRPGLGHAAARAGAAAAAAEEEEEGGGAWWYLLHAEQVGPVGAVELLAQLRGGALTPTTYVYEEGTAEWVELSEVVERLPKPSEFSRVAAGAAAGAGAGAGAGAEGGGLVRAGGFRSSSPVRGRQLSQQLSVSPVGERSGGSTGGAATAERGQERRSSVGWAPVFPVRPKRLSASAEQGGTQGRSSESASDTRRGSVQMQPPDVMQRTGRARVSSHI